MAFCFVLKHGIFFLTLLLSLDSVSSIEITNSCKNGKRNPLFYKARKSISKKISKLYYSKGLIWYWGTLSEKDFKKGIYDQALYQLTIDLLRKKEKISNNYTCKQTINLPKASSFKFRIARALCDQYPSSRAGNYCHVLLKISRKQASRLIKAISHLPRRPLHNSLLCKSAYYHVGGFPLDCTGKAK